MISILQKLACMATVLLIFLITSGNTYGQSDIWVGTWSTANYAAGANNTPPSPFLANNTLRQIVRVSIGGDSLRVKFSNKTCATPVTMKSVNLAVSKGGSSIDASTITPLTFSGNSSVTMDAFSGVTSDPVAFALKPSMRVAITIHYGEAKSDADITSHVGSRTDSYILPGDNSTSADFDGSVITAHWFHINTIDVTAPDSAGCVAILGNSITDGYGLSGGLQNRWPDIFSQQLLNDSRTKNVGVLNLGIGGTNLTTSGLSRYKDFGNIFLLNQIVEAIGLHQICTNSFVEHHKELLALAYYQIIESSPLYLSPYWLDETHLPHVARMDSSAISKFCQEVGSLQQQRVHFQEQWIARLQPFKVLYYDITSISSYSTNVEYVEWGYNRDKEALPQVNMGVVFCNRSSLPIFYNLYPGSIVDVKTLANCVKFLQALGFAYYSI